MRHRPYSLSARVGRRLNSNRRSRKSADVAQRLARASQRRKLEPDTSFRRVTFSLPRAQARIKAREFLDRYPKAAYMTRLESLRELPGDVFEFAMRRLPSTD